RRARSTLAPLPRWAPGLLGVRRPAGAVGALLASLPFAEDEGVLAEAESALRVLALRDGKPEPAVVRALEDRAPQRRATAAEIVCQASSAGEHRAALQRL